MVGDTGIEPVTPSMSTKCSTAELITPMACASSSPRVILASAPTKGARECSAPVRRSIKGVETGIKGFWRANFAPIMPARGPHAQPFVSP